MGRKCLDRCLEAKCFPVSSKQLASRHLFRKFLPFYYSFVPRPTILWHFIHFVEPATWPSSTRIEDPTCAIHVGVLTIRSAFLCISTSKSCIVSHVNWVACAKNSPTNIYFCRWAFGWDGESQCFRLARWISTVCLDPLVIECYDIWLLGICLENFFPCTRLLSWENSPFPFFR